MQLPFGLGGSNLQVEIALDSSGIISELPSWKVRKNAFAHALKEPSDPRSVTTSSSTTMTQNKALSSKQSSSSWVEASYIYEADDDVKGSVILSLPYGKRVDHLGIKVELVGRIFLEALAVHDGRAHYDFISLSKELAPPGTIYAPSMEFAFLFKNVEKSYESYHGRNVSIRYIVRVAVERKFLPPISSEKEVIVQIIEEEPKVNEPIKMEVGIEDCLHIEFEYERKCYHLKDVIVGKINFLLVKIKIKYMELAVIRRETSGENVQMPTGHDMPISSSSTPLGNHVNTETQTLVKHEIMDGAPVKGETIPVKLFLAGIPADLTPSYSAQQNRRFSVKYFLNLVLVDQEDRRYFKQQEIFLWRKVLG